MLSVTPPSLRWAAPAGHPLPGCCSRLGLVCRTRAIMLMWSPGPKDGERAAHLSDGRLLPLSLAGGDSRRRWWRGDDPFSRSDPLCTSTGLRRAVFAGEPSADALGAGRAVRPASDDVSDCALPLRPLRYERPPSRKRFLHHPAFLDALIGHRRLPEAWRPRAVSWVLGNVGWRLSPVVSAIWS